MTRGFIRHGPAIDGRAIYDRAQELAFPRYPGTKGDRRAIEIVTSWFEAAGLEVVCEPFSYDVRPAFRALRAMLLICAALVAGSGALASTRPGIALVALALALASGGAFLSWAPWLERIYERDGPTETANVVGRRRSGSAGGTPRLTLILMAHHDSKSQSLTLPYRALATIAAIASVLALAFLELVALGGGRVEPVAVGLVSGAACVALVVLSTLRSGNRSPGGVDNAGSVAILAEVAAPVSRRVAPDTELVFLSPGAEEDHMVGAMRWLERHWQELVDRPVLVLNLDGAGIPGRVALLERYGLGRRFSARLSVVARGAARDLGLEVRGAMLPPAMGVDAIPFAHRGIESLTLASGSLGRPVLAVHSKHDRGDNLGPRALEDVARLTVAMVALLSSEPPKAQADS
ncbi:MAG: M28 family peptidase [Thermoanaerobaculia bacterium]